MSAQEKPCAECGKAFARNRKFSPRQWEAARYCGRECSGIARQRANASGRPPLRDLFETRVQKSDGCWRWLGTLDGYGYGVLDYAGKRYRAHVLALEFDGRPVPSGKMGLHHCDNPQCVRPDHLYAGTAKENVTDAMVRGRLCVGGRHHSSKLTDDDVRLIRLLRLTPTETARRFGVSRPTAARVLRNVTWRHVT